MRFLFEETASTKNKTKTEGRRPSASVGLRKTTTKKQQHQICKPRRLILPFRLTNVSCFCHHQTYRRGAKPPSLRPPRPTPPSSPYLHTPTSPHHPTQPKTKPPRKQNHESSSSTRRYSPTSPWCSTTFAPGSRSLQYSVGCAAMPKPAAVSGFRVEWWDHCGGLTVRLHIDNHKGTPADRPKQATLDHAYDADACLPSGTSVME